MWAAIVVGGCAAVDYSYALSRWDPGWSRRGKIPAPRPESCRYNGSEDTEAVGRRVMNGVQDAKVQVMPL